MSTTTDRPPVRPRSGRRPLPPLIFLLVLAIAALGVWWKVFGDAAEKDERRDAACAAASAAPPQLDPASVSLRVYNATETAGLAQQVAVALQARGFQVTDIDNDPQDRVVTGVGELRHGARGEDAALFVEVYLPGVTFNPDTRADRVVDVVVGPEFAALRTAEEVNAVLNPASSAAAECESDAAA